MEKQFSQSMKVYLAVVAMLAWFAIIAQFYLQIGASTDPIFEVITRFFSYFTILTNLIIAVCCTVLLLKPGSKWGSFFSRQQTLAALTVYIVIVGLIYNTILRFTWEPKGLQKIVDELLHSVIPVLFLVFWLVFVHKNQLQWKGILPWLIYPFAYIFFVLIRGSISGFYPYPFINTYNLGINKVVVNAVGIAIIFIIVSLIFTGIGKFLNKKI